MAAGQNSFAGEAQVAGDAENGSRADRRRQLGRGLECRIRLDREYDEVGVRDDVLVALRLRDVVVHAFVDEAAPVRR